ncbi:bacteriohemerythrin [Psychromonas sp.]|uniref:sensor domain-containing diguanylate cyclase n=1 Tax=Psychromonas sp. TaxID=1884585 RepID=UPI00356199E2
MESFSWDTYFVTGIEEVDDQHFHLVALINKFGNALVNNEIAIQDVESILRELKEYTIYHFQGEEALMKKVGIDARFLAEHMKVHLDFTSKISVIATELSINNRTTAKNLFEFLLNWLVSHMLGMDQNMARQIAAIKNGSTAGQAFHNENIEVDNATEGLLNALGNLFEQLSERNKELHELNQTLEKQVTQRTLALQNANLALEQLALTDELTNLPNRRFAMAHLDKLWQEALQKHKPLSCLMIDADHFKGINDTYGHDAGDTVLTALSQQLTRNLRNDDIICRLGGDEFLVICENTDFSGAQYIAQSLCDAVAELKVQQEEMTWFGSVSIGVASRQENMRNIDELLKLTQLKQGDSCRQRFRHCNIKLR